MESKITILVGMIALPIGHRFEILPHTPSTNLYAMQQIHARLAEHGQVFFTHEQTAGKGQRGKQWHAKPGENIAMSVILSTSQFSISQSFRLSAAVAVGLQQFIATKTALNTCIKWPNDIFINDRKAAGVLIENVFRGGKWIWSVVGVGINVNEMEFPDHLPQAISLKMLTGNHYDTEALARELLPALELRWQQLCAGQSEQILSDYNNALYARQQVVRLKKDNAVIPCRIKYVNQRGTLIAGENNEWQFEHGEVEWPKPS